jgi:hypothetical protein
MNFSFVSFLVIWISGLPKFLFNRKGRKDGAESAEEGVFGIQYSVFGRNMK